jgi:lambda family phage portal protein
MMNSKIGNSYPAPVVEMQRKPQAGAKRRYEGAADGRRASSWLSNGNPSVNLLIAKDLLKLVQRSRELAINNPYAKKAPYIIANNLVGTGILLTPTIADKIENGTVKKFPGAAKLQKTIAAAWKDWAEKLSADYNGDFTFYGLQHLAVRTKVISGEVLAVRRYVEEDVNKYGFQVLILEGDFIDQSKDTTKDKDGGYTFKGVKYSKDGKRSGYWLFDRHPSEGNAKSTFYQMKDVIHLYEVERPGQSRGVPDAAPTMTTQRDFADYMDAELIAKKGAACFSAIVSKAEPPETDPTQDLNNQLEELQPGTIQYLAPGETIHFPTLPQNPGLTDFVKVQLRAIAAGYLMPYENLTGDLSNVTFISGRLGQLDFKKQVEYWQHVSFIPKFCERVFQWFVYGAKIALGLPEDMQAVGSWTAPRWQFMDPGKEVAAMLAEVQAGFATWSEKVRENGYNPDEVLEEMTNDQNKFVASGLMPKWSQFFELMAKVKMNQGKQTDPAETAKE